jgi:hypothetical protein
MDSRIKAALVRARDKIAQGWVQDMGQDDDGNVCTSFAINAAAAEVLVARSTLSSQVANDAAEVMFQAITELTGEDWSHNIVGWNDRTAVVLRPRCSTPSTTPSSWLSETTCNDFRQPRRNWEGRDR